MKTSRAKTRAFTLIELLAVIGIIGILAALLFPAIKLALQKAEIAQAQNDIKNIETAVKSFYTEYGKWPNGNGGTFDFSYGAFGANGSAYGPSHPTPPSVLTGYCENHWLMDTLQAIQDNSTLCGNGGTLTSPSTTPVNSRGIVFINIPAKSLKLSTDNTLNPNPNAPWFDFVDPWGNPYQITVDTAYANTCTNLANTVNNSAAITPVGTGTFSGCVTNTVAVWSFGVPGPYGPHTAKDWITSW
jgi:prepilin-type N-terminal cleavage/methylation domain-containing protein